MPRPATAPHGTIAAARRHERRGEQLCPACQQARRDYNHEQYLRRKEKKL